MAWVTDEAIAAAAAVDQPIKGETIRKVQLNITEAFAGSEGGPPLASSLAGNAIAGLGLNEIGTYRIFMSTQTGPTSGGAPTNAYTPGTTFAGSDLGVGFGTWLAMGGDFTGGAITTDPEGGVSTFYYSNLFLRVV